MALRQGMGTDALQAHVDNWLEGLRSLKEAAKDANDALEKLFDTRFGPMTAAQIKELTAGFQLPFTLRGTFGGTPEGHGDVFDPNQLMEDAVKAQAAAAAAAGLPPEEFAQEHNLVSFGGGIP